MFFSTSHATTYLSMREGPLPLAPKEFWESCIFRLGRGFSLFMDSVLSSHISFSLNTRRHTGDRKFTRRIGTSIASNQGIPAPSKVNRAVTAVRYSRRALFSPFFYDALFKPFPHFHHIAIQKPLLTKRLHHTCMTDERQRGAVDTGSGAELFSFSFFCSLTECRPVSVWTGESGWDHFMSRGKRPLEGRKGDERVSAYRARVVSGTDGKPASGGRHSGTGFVSGKSMIHQITSRVSDHAPD